MVSQSPLNQPKRIITLTSVVGLVLVLGLLVASLAISITLGAADISVDAVYTSLFRFDGSFEHLIIRTVRLPRVLAGAVVGAALAVSGAIMQGLTRNPLASPGILGINAGAAFAVVLAVLILGSPPLATYALFAFIGAAVAAVLVYTLGSIGRGGPTPLKLTLAGAVFTAFMSSFTSAILIMDQDTLDQVRFWTAGSLAGRDMALLARTTPYVAVGLVIALLMGRQITTLSLGDDVAVGLGQNTTWIKLIAAFAVVLLAGGAVALAGPIGFVGLVIPHVVRFTVSVDYRWILPYAALAGGLLVTIADIAARIIIRPQELPVGVMMALVGAPFFIYLARYKVRR
ncbi:MAG: iron ABC transporter permease [Deinococcota bacterium]